MSPLAGHAGLLRVVDPLPGRAAVGALVDPVRGEVDRPRRRRVEGDAVGSVQAWARVHVGGLPGRSVVGAAVQQAWNATAAETGQQMAGLVGVCRHVHEPLARRGRGQVPSRAGPVVAPIGARVEARVGSRVDALRVEGVDKDPAHLRGSGNRQEGPGAGAVEAAIDPQRAVERRVDAQRIGRRDRHRGAAQGGQSLDLVLPGGGRDRADRWSSAPRPRRW